MLSRISEISEGTTYAGENYKIAWKKETGFQPVSFV